MPRREPPLVARVDCIEQLNKQAGHVFYKTYICRHVSMVRSAAKCQSGRVNEFMAQFYCVIRGFLTHVIRYRVLETFMQGAAPVHNRQQTLGPKSLVRAW